MRIAILSDVHSNLPALVKALSIIDELRVDAIYCLGDIVGYGASPNECIQLVRERASKCVLGNHDLAVLDVSYAEYLPKDGEEAADWTRMVLKRENAEFLGQLSYTEGNEFCTIVHASPHDPAAWKYITSLEDARPQFEHFTTQLCFIGHTHIPFLCGDDLKTFTFRKDRRYLINVGSVGQPRDGNPQLSFGVLDTNEWIYQNIRAHYDVERAAEAIRLSGLPESLGNRLFRGI